MVKSKVHVLALDKNENELLDKYFISCNENIELVKLNHLDEAKKEMRNFKITHLVICNQFFQTNNIEFIREHALYFLNTKVLLIGEDQKETYDLRIYIKSLTILAAKLTILEKSKAFTNYFYDLDFQNETKVFLPFNIKLFDTIEYTPCDLYIKINDSKFVKILSHDQTEPPSDVINKYISKGISEIYAEANDLNRVRDLIEKGIFQTEAHNDNLEKKLKIADNVITIAKNFGVSEFLIEGINETFSEINNDLQKDKKLKSILSLINAKNNNPIINHSYLTAVFCAILSQKFQWVTASIRKSFFMSALLHDLEIIESHNQIFEFKPVADINELPTKQKNQFINHGTKLSQSLTQNINIPNDVINIIAKHHEGAMEKSFPQGLGGNQLGQLNFLFNTAHQFTIELSNVGFNQNKIDTALNNLKAHYTSKGFLPFIDVLEVEIRKMNL